MPVCFPPGADWSCAYTPEQLAEMLADPASAAAMERSEALAWMSLSALTGYQVATCPITVRPCVAGCQAPGTWMVAPVLSGGHYAGIRPGLYSQWMPHISATGAWVNSCGCRSAGDCGCTALCEAILPGHVGGIVEVWLDGAVVPPSAYRVDNGNRLVRTDGECWPSCQDLTEHAHGDNAFSVTYYAGAAPDITTLWAAGRLATEFYKACIGSGECALPAGTVSVARQGISVEIDAGLFPGGRTNIPEVDALIEIYNPHGLRSAPVIASPDTRRTRMTTVQG